LVSIVAPASEAELMERAHALAGRRLGDLANLHGLEVPIEMRRAKGFAGTLLERCLGATAGSRALPDFEGLGVELKTLPLDRAGRPLESTFVCTIELTELADSEWATSRVRKKLARVLWVPLLSERERPLVERTVGTPLLWSPTAAQEADLRWDWEEIAGLIGLGRIDDITGHLGRCLQMRPKASNSRARRVGIDDEGIRVEVLPRGFYLRPSFTATLFREFLA
jgi:DNA mismatch repair protein MutH